MNIKTAIDVFKQKYPNRIVFGYWANPGEFVLNTATTLGYLGPVEPGQFVVTDKHEVYGTNPMRSNLDPKNMHVV